jgi:hypothetical protein
MLLLPEQLERLERYTVHYDKSKKVDTVSIYLNSTGIFGRHKTKKLIYSLARTSNVNGDIITHSMREEMQHLINQLEEYVRMKFNGYKMVKKGVGDWMDEQLEKEVLGSLPNE